MVTYSGGKGICGPQNSGLLAGRADLIEAAFMNYLPAGAPRAGIARPAKVSKETIVGLVTAIELFLDSDHESVWAGWRQKCDHVVDKAQRNPRPPGGDRGKRKPAGAAAGGVSRTRVERSAC